MCSSTAEQLSADVGINDLTVWPGERNKSGVGSEEIGGLSGVSLEEQYPYSDLRLVVNTLLSATIILVRNKSYCPLSP